MLFQGVNSLINYYLAATTKGYSTGDTTGSYGTYLFFSNDAFLLIRHLQVGTTTGSGTGTEGQYATTTGHHSEALPSHHKHHLGGVHSQEVTDTGVKPSMTDKIVGGAEKAAGKMTSNTGMYQKGAERAVSWLSPSVYSVLNICIEYQGWRNRTLEEADCLRIIR